ncbi:MAG: glucosamine-6-phosphate deaminase [Clostridiales bacterium]|nr:glucosamine-6-phosphate deaminase [Clostridiales bacterium]
MDIRIFSNENEIGATASEIVINCVSSKEHPVLGLATGASPVNTYKHLIEAYRSGRISFKNVTTFNLDEYCGIPRNDKNSYYTFMHENLFNMIDIKEENVHIPDGNPSDPAYFTDGTYDRMIDNAGGIDLQILGIGRNGHIGFNEPGEFKTGTFKVTLSQSTIEANKIYFENEQSMPKEAVTMGVGSILKAREIILIAEGSAKANAVRAMIKDDMSTLCPASLLQKHSNVHILLDREASALL